MIKLTDDNEIVSRRLADRIPQEQWEHVMAGPLCYIDAEFLGFVAIYARLAGIIPQHFTVVDLGCAYAPQAFLFDGHKQYVGVDAWCLRRFSTPNTCHYTMTIAAFIEEHAAQFDLDETFAICSYVPPWQNDNQKLARAAFRNVFCFYPSDKAEVRRLRAQMMGAIHPEVQHIPADGRSVELPAIGTVGRYDSSPLDEGRIVERNQSPLPSSRAAKEKE